MGKLLLLTVVKSSLQNAGPKAPLDICKILEADGRAECAVFPAVEGSDFPVYLDVLDRIREAVRTEKRVILQYPLQPFAYHDRQGEFMGLLEEADPGKTVILLHDMNHIRFGNRQVYEREMERLGRFRYFVVHNNQMERYLRQFVPDCRCVQMELFDYLCEDFEKGREKNYSGERPEEWKAAAGFPSERELQVVFAGNLAVDKSAFLYQLERDKMDFVLHLYGRRVQRIANGKVRYMGSAAAEALPGRLKGDLGLIWDGQLDGRADQSLERLYTRYNTPHKFSCYMAAGMPVIAWKNAAVADMVDRYQVGYLIDHLYEVDSLDLSMYEEYRKNARNLGEKVRRGYFTRKMFAALQEWKDVFI